MRKKGLVPASTVSILLTLPEGTAYQPAINTFLENQAFVSQPFFFNPEGNTVTIGLVRELLHHSSFARSAAEPQALVVCAVHTATIPAQNALLKVVEEPPAHTQIILAAYPGHQLLPTLVSRCREILWTEKAAAEQGITLREEGRELEAFLQQPANFSYSDLISLAETLKDGETAKQVLRLALRDYAQSTKSPISPVTLQNLALALESLEKNGNVRLVLEHYFFLIKEQAVGS